ncbi:MAG: nuclear transport factor 2 family protein [Acidimicrobiales bacterium]
MDNHKDFDTVGHTNTHLVRRGWEAALGGDLDAISENLDPDVKWHGGDPTDPGACHNRDETLAFIRQATQRRPLPQLVDVRGAADKVVVILRRPASPDSQPQLFANLTVLRDGKVVEMVHYDNPDEALAAVGLDQ